LLELVTEGKYSLRSDGPSEKMEHEGTPSNSSSPSVGSVQATPAVRHLAKSYAINISDVPGSGDNGRILREDVVKFVMSKEEMNEELRMVEPPGDTEGTVLYAETSSESSSDSDVEVDDLQPKGHRTFSTQDLGDKVSVAMNPVIENVLGRDTKIPVRYVIELATITKNA
jgi:pyruvate/2-oxoglutarate dehydrogenase complex dihydrolipoamide acyltransferase (E2) component